MTFDMQAKMFSLSQAYPLKFGNNITEEEAGKMKVDFQAGFKERDRLAEAETIAFGNLTAYLMDLQRETKDQELKRKVTAVLNYAARTLRGEK